MLIRGSLNNKTKLIERYLRNSIVKKKQLDLLILYLKPLNITNNFSYIQNRINSI